MNKLNLKKFEGQGSKINRKISITRSRSFGIPPYFYRENNISGKIYVDIYFDENKKIIGLMFKESNENGGFKLQTYGEADKIGGNVIAQSFFKSYNINASKYRGKYTPKKHELEGVGEVFLLDLSENQPLDTE